MWAITGMGQPSTMVRLMAFRDSRRSGIDLYLTVYNFMIYIPLIMIFIAARAILPDLANTDEVMPRLAITLANPYVAGLILAAPLRGGDEHGERLPPDRRVGPGARPLSAFFAAVGVGKGDRVGELRRDRGRGAGGGRAGLLHPPQYLQLIIVFSSSGMARWPSCAPAGCSGLLASGDGAGAIAAMWPGGTTCPRAYGLLGLTLGGHDQGIGPARGRTCGPYYLLGLEPAVWGMLASRTGVVVSLLSSPPDPERMALFRHPAARPPAPAATLGLHSNSARTDAEHARPNLYQIAAHLRRTRRQQVAHRRLGRDPRGSACAADLGGRLVVFPECADWLRVRVGGTRRSRSPRDPGAETERWRACRRARDVFAGFGTRGTGRKSKRLRPAGA